MAYAARRLKRCKGQKVCDLNFFPICFYKMTLDLVENCRDLFQYLLLGKMSLSLLSGVAGFVHAANIEKLWIVQQGV